MKRPNVLTWIMQYPLWFFMAFLLVEAGLPVRWQPTAWVLRGSIRLYQWTLSPVLPSQCRFTPTCSQYGLKAIQKYGTLRGGALTAWRILRCNPFGGHGEDPVP